MTEWIIQLQIDATAFVQTNGPMSEDDLKQIVEDQLLLKSCDISVDYCLDYVECGEPFINA